MRPARRAAPRSPPPVACPPVLLRQPGDRSSVSSSTLVQDSVCRGSCPRTNGFPEQGRPNAMVPAASRIDRPEKRLGGTCDRLPRWSRARGPRREGRASAQPRWPPESASRFTSSRPSAGLHGPLRGPPRPVAAVGAWSPQAASVKHRRFRPHRPRGPTWPPPSHSRLPAVLAGNRRALRSFPRRSACDRSSADSASRRVDPENAATPSRFPGGREARRGPRRRPPAHDSESPSDRCRPRPQPPDERSRTKPRVAVLPQANSD